MILVTVGTQDKAFTRLMDALEQQIQTGLIQDEILVQSGYTQFSSAHMRVQAYFSQDELDQARQAADLIITHGGVGSILDGLKLGKRIIGVARLKQYKEHINDHQEEILKQFEADGHLLWCQDFSQLHNYIQQAQTFTPKPYPFNNQTLIEVIAGLIDQD